MISWKKTAAEGDNRKIKPFTHSREGGPIERGKQESLLAFLPEGNLHHNL